jgi:uncharacterized Fe-S cluster protein YjdI
VRRLSKTARLQDIMKITWNDKICIQAGIFVKSLPSVFQVKDGKFVINEKCANEVMIRDVVSRCTSGALKIQ